MGEVWRGEHVDSGLPVAIKLVRPDLVHDDGVRWDFEREIRWQAGLEHPGIVYLYDHGTLSPEAAAIVGTPPGGPWLAMEHCSGTLKDIAPGLSWPGTRSLLKQLLDALAHAHAHGLLHRDLKIANVLVSTDADVRPGIKLADFGIAHALGDSEETTRSVGTPRYMAPEQVAGEWEDHGPWTDLYALGVLAWRLVTGHKPFGDLQGSHLALAMVHKPLGWPGARFEVPPGIEHWLERMTAKDPSERFQLAADASEALMAFPDTDTAGIWMPLEQAGTLIPLDEDEDDDEMVPTPRAPMVRPMEDPPPESEANIRMHAAGLNLLGLRRPALIGRKAERNRAWKILRRVATTGQPALLTVTGPPRVGRSRFQEWLCETAERTGQGVSLTIRCIPGRPLGDQVVQALRHWFRVGSRSLSETLDHLETWMGSGPWLHDTAAMLVRRSAGDPSWQATLSAALANLGKRRPLVLRFVGSDRTPEVPGFVARLLEMGHAPVVVVVDREVELPDAETRSKEVAVRLGPLEDAAMHRMADALVMLDPDVRSRLVSRAGGSPGFLVQTLTHWGSRGLLRPGPNGYVVDDVDGDLPPTMAVVASIRHQAMLQRVGPDGARSMQRAALLGDEVDEALWAAVDGRSRAALRAGVREALFEDGLGAWVTGRRGVWRFTSVPFREAVLEHAVDVASDHRRVAEVIEASDASADLDLGRHLLAAGDTERALQPLARGVWRVATRDGAEAGLAALGELARAVDKLEGPARLRWTAVQHQLEARLFAETGQLDDAEERARTALRTAEVLHDDALTAGCWSALGDVARGRGDDEAQIDAYSRALELGDRAAPPHTRARWWVALGNAHLERGERTRWAECLHEAATCAGDDPDVAHIQPMAAAARAQVSGDLEEALAALDRASRVAADSGAGHGRLAVQRLRATLLQDAHRWTQARSVFAGALELAVAMRSPMAPEILADAVTLEVLDRHPRRAVDVFDRHRYLLPAGQDRRAALVPLHCAALAVASEKADWRHVTYHLERIRQHPGAAGSRVHRSVVCFAFAAERARSAGRGILADAIVEVAQTRVARSSG